MEYQRFLLSSMLVYMELANTCDGDISKLKILAFTYGERLLNKKIVPLVRIYDV